MRLSNEIGSLPKLFWFLDAGMTNPSTRCGGRRPKSAQAPKRGELGTGWQRVGDGELMLAPISMMGETPARRHLDVCTDARLGERSRHFGGRSERVNGRSAGWGRWLGREGLPPGWGQGPGDG